MQSDDAPTNHCGPLINLLLLIAPLASLLKEEYKDGERQAKHCDDVTEGFRRGSRLFRLFYARTQTKVN